MKLKPHPSPKKLSFWAKFVQKFNQKNPSETSQLKKPIVDVNQVLQPKVPPVNQPSSVTPVAPNQPPPTPQIVPKGPDSYLWALIKRNNKSFWDGVAGIAKEFSRISWLKGAKLWSAYAVVIQIIVIGGLIFYVITTIAGLI